MGAEQKQQRDSGHNVQQLLARVEELETAKRRTHEYQRLFEYSATLSAIIDFRGVFVKLSAGWSRTLGYTTEELSQRRFLDLVHENDAETTLARSACLADPDEETITFENRYRARDGSYRWLSWYAVGNLDDQLIYAVALDVTEEKTAYAELERQRDMLRRTEAIANIGGWEYHAATGRFSWSAEVFRIHEKAGEPPSLSEFLAYFAPTVQKEVKRLFRVVVDEGSAWDERFPFTTCAGHRRWMRLQGEPKLDEGRVTGAVGTIRDITAQHRAEQERDREEHLLRELHAITAWHDRTLEERILGVLDLGLACWRVEVAVLSEGSGAVQRVIYSRGRQAEANDESYQPLQPGYVRATVTVAQRPYGVLSFSAQTEGEYSGRDQELVNLLARWIGYELEREQAKQESEAANQRVVAASAAKTAFLATISHEIRTPLNGVLGMAQLLQQTPLTEEQHHFVSTLQSSGDGLLTIINELLDFSKIEAGKLELVSESFEVERVVREVVDLLAARAAQKGVELILELPKCLPAKILGDAGRIRQVLMNFVSNAVKFTASGHILVKVTTVRRGADTELAFFVQDTGIGIGEEVQAKLFQPFTQADATLTRQYGGTGLGLAVCRQLASLMGGEVGVKSRLNEGSTFWFSATLPATWEPEMEAPPQRERLLLIDHYPESWRVHAQDLSRLGYTVLSADPALSPANMLAELGPDIVVVNLRSDTKVSEREELECAEQFANHPAIAGCVLILHPQGWVRADAPDWYKRSNRMTRPVDRNIWVSSCNALLSSTVSQRSRQVRLRRQQSAAVPEANSPGPKVLLVEDNRVNQMVARKMLEKLGCTVDIAADGKEAVRSTEQFSYDIIFMDCQMPVMDGFQATELIRARERELKMESVRIVALTANTLKEDRERCSMVGMNGFVAKPIQAQELAQALKVIPD